MADYDDDDHNMDVMEDAPEDDNEVSPYHPIHHLTTYSALTVYSYA